MSQKENEPKFFPESIADLLAKPQPEIDWLIKDIWTAGGRGFIAGNPKIGKTWLALEMLMSVATGQKCLGKFDVKQAPVLLVEEEGSLLGLARRVHGLARARGFKDSELSKFFHITRQFVRIPEDMTEIFSFAFAEGVKLIVFDSLRRFHSGNENSSEEMQRVLDSFGKLSSMADTAVVLIHHLSKGSRDLENRPVFERLRGTGDFWAWCDCLIGMEGEEEGENAEVVLQFRDAETPSPFTLRRHIDSMSGAISLTALDASESESFIERSQAIVTFMKTQFGGVLKEVVFKQVKGRKADFVKTWRVLEKNGVVEKNGTGWVVSDVPF